MLSLLYCCGLGLVKRRGGSCFVLPICLQRSEDVKQMSLDLQQQQLTMSTMLQEKNDLIAELTEVTAEACARAEEKSEGGGTVGMGVTGLPCVPTLLQRLRELTELRSTGCAVGVQVNTNEDGNGGGEAHLELAAVRDEVAMLTAKLQALTHQSSSASRKLKAAERDLARLTQECDTLKEENLQLHQRLAETEASGHAAAQAGLVSLEAGLVVKLQGALKDARAAQAAAETALAQERGDLLASGGMQEYLQVSMRLHRRQLQQGQQRCQALRRRAYRSMVCAGEQIGHARHWKTYAAVLNQKMASLVVELRRQNMLQAQVRLPSC